MDLLATNQLGRAMHASLYDRATGGAPNFARYTFLDDDARRFYPEWNTAADTCVAILRTEAGRDPHDKRLHDLVGELSTRSDDFRRRWSSHDVRLHGAGTKRFHHTHRRRTRPRLRKHGHALRTRTDPHPLRRRTGLPHRRRPRSPRVLDHAHHSAGDPLTPAGNAEPPSDSPPLSQINHPPNHHPPARPTISTPRFAEDKDLSVIHQRK